MRRLVSVVALGLALVVAGACSGGSGDETASGRAAPPDAGAGLGTGEEAATGAEPSRAVPAGELLSDQPGGRDIVHTAEVHLRADDVGEAARRAMAVAEGVGGFVFGQQSELEGDPSALLTLKVPPASVRSVLDALAGLGEPLRQTVEAADVTDQVVDLEGRITTARVSVARLRAFLERATTVQEVAALEGELTRRETELEQLEGRLRVLRDRVDLATITVHISAAPAVGGGDLPGFTDALAAGWAALRQAVAVVALVVGAVLPWLPVVGGVAALAWRLRRGRGPRPAADTT